MKKRCVIIVLVVMMLGLVCAGVSVKNADFETDYALGDVVFGVCNFTISNAELKGLFTSNFNGEISLEDFLLGNSEYFDGDDCSSFDCEDSYDDTTVGKLSETFNVLNNGEIYFGFVLTGTDVEINGLGFKISSDFEKSDKVPLKMDFFESGEWIKFSESSSDFTRSESWGCYGSGNENVAIKKSIFCEKINIPETSFLEVGALISGAGTNEVEMVVYDSTSEIDSCKFKPSSTKNSCVLSLSEGSLSKGDYYVCVEASGDTGYTLKKETGGSSCGWANNYNNFNVPDDFTRDYAIFARTPKYSSADETDFDLILSGDEIDLISDAQDFIDIKYGGDCSPPNYCVLPVKVSGVAQNLIISNISVNYTDDSEPKFSNKVYRVKKIPVTIDFEEVLELDMEFLNFSVNDMDEDEFVLYFDGSKIFEEDIEVLPAPVINSIYPLNPLAGVSVSFTADVNSTNTIKSYEWDFGDDSMIEQTTNNSVNHVYEEIDAYTLTLTVIDAQNLEAFKEFSIIVGSPEKVIDKVLEAKKASLQNAINNINQLGWYKEDLKKILDIDFISSELDRLTKEDEDAFDEDEFLNIAIELQDLEVPSSVVISETSILPLITNLDDIDIEPVENIGGGSIEDFLEEQYQNSILRWQRQNIDADVKNEKILVSNYGGGEEIVLNVYSIDIDSTAGSESYFVIGISLDELSFKEGSARKSGEYSVIILDKNSENEFDFYFEGDEDLIMFVSPKLSLLEISAEVGVCNYDGVCDKEFGEDYENCRKDCKPIFKMILYIILVLIFGLIVYTVLQVWYKTRYEGHLFKDRNNLFNLLMFIDNAKARGMDESKIKTDLKVRKWKREQIEYALKKSRGEKTGMYEIIPIEKLFAHFRRKKAEEKVAARGQVMGKGYGGRGGLGV